MVIWLSRVSASPSRRRTAGRSQPTGGVSSNSSKRRLAASVGGGCCCSRRRNRAKADAAAAMSAATSAPSAPSTAAATTAATAAASDVISGQPRDACRVRSPSASAAASQARRASAAALHRSIAGVVGRIACEGEPFPQFGLPRARGDQRLRDLRGSLERPSVEGWRVTTGVELRKHGLQLGASLGPFLFDIRALDALFAKGHQPPLGGPDVLVRRPRLREAGFLEPSRCCCTGAFLAPRTLA